jgi:hypothetical protein
MLKTKKEEKGKSKKLRETKKTNEENQRREPCYHKALL